MQLNTGRYLEVFALVTLVICGTVQYFTGIVAVLWLPFFMVLLMVVLLIMYKRQQPLLLTAGEKGLLTLYLTFIVLSLASTFLQGGAIVTVVGFKNELALSLLMLCMLLGMFRESQLHRLTQMFYWLFYVQFPVAAYQVLVMVPRRVAFRGEDEKWDSVVGTFGGDPMGGGNTAAMGMFCLLIMLLKVSEFKHGICSFKSMALHIVLAFVLCVVGEVKFVILLSPFLLALLWIMPGYVSGVSKVSLRSLLIIAVGMVVLIFAAITILASNYSSAFGGDPTKSAFSVFVDSLGYIFDTNYIMENGELGRLTTIFFWLKHNSLSGIGSVLFGYGLNATNSGSSVSPGYISTWFHLILDSTSLSMLLWEVGIIGVLLLTAIAVMVLIGLRPRETFARGDLNREDLQLLSSAPAFYVFIVGCLLSLPYSQIMMIIPMLQFLLWLAIGALIVIHRSVRLNSGTQHD
ncbi:capsular polysaccharide biosynthesis protein [Salmonella enterica subsp. enterica serovar Choleraesuis]|nr:capsular polysaccharide biosynthesis protein [Salmonella enterica subsp. enterica serovar Choleraesuis]